MTKADRDAARHIPMDAEIVWAFQVDYGGLEELATCMEMLADYGYHLVAYSTESFQVAFAVVDDHGRQQSVRNLDWIVFRGGEVITVSGETFGGYFRKFEEGK